LSLKVAEVDPLNFGEKLTKYRKIEARSWKQCCSGKTTSIA